MSTRPGPAAVFVYGTLRAGGAHGALLRDLARHEARVRGHVFDLPAGYPALVVAEGEDWVYGELIEGVSERILGLLDQYEGVAEGLYRRIVVEAWLGLRPVAAWAWVMDHPERQGGVRIPSGRWRPSRKR